MNKTRHEVCALAEIAPGDRKIVQIGHRSIGIFNVDGTLYAIKNSCPHQGAELCRGPLGGTMLPAQQAGQYSYGLEGQVLRCPWHFWEFDITTGESVFVPNNHRVQTYKVDVEAMAVEKQQSPQLEKFEVQIEQEVVVLYL